MFIFYIIIFLFFFNSCDNFDNMLSENWQKRTIARKPSVENLERWKDELAMEEEEILQLEKKIYTMVHKTRKAGSVAWKIAKAYTRVGDFDMGIKYYNKALKDKIENNQNTEVHFFESSIPYYEKALKYKPINQDLLFETGIAYANSAKDRGWERERTKASIDIFQGLLKKDKDDTRYPFQLALIYFDSSVYYSIFDKANDININYQKNIDRAFALLDAILQKEPNNIPTHFAKANFLYRIGRNQEALNQYFQIKSTLERLKKSGVIKGNLEKNTSYINVIKNINQIQK